MQSLLPAAQAMVQLRWVFASAHAGADCMHCILSKLDIELSSPLLQTMHAIHVSEILEACRAFVIEMCCCPDLPQVAVKIHAGAR